MLRSRVSNAFIDSARRLMEFGGFDNTGFLIGFGNNFYFYGELPLPQV